MEEQKQPSVVVFQEESQFEKPPILSVVTCHPSSPEVSALRSSLATNSGLGDTEVICVVGAPSIAVAYNLGARAARGRVLMFVHSDVEVLTSRAMLSDAINNCSYRKMGVLGIAGGRVLKQNPIWWAQRDNLSGACMHMEVTNGVRRIWMTAFGAYSQVVCLDGVLMMCHRDVYSDLSGFDESLPGWDFYDIDFTLRAYLKGYINLTFPLHVLHYSQGDTSNKAGWHANRSVVAKRYEKVLPVTLEVRHVDTSKKDDNPSGGSGAPGPWGGRAPGGAEEPDREGHSAPARVPDGPAEADKPEAGAPLH